MGFGQKKSGQVPRRAAFIWTDGHA